MEQVSQEWLDNQKQKLVSESFVRLTLNMVDPDAGRNATITSNGIASIVETPQEIIDDATKIEYGSLEQNFYLLNDDTFNIATDSSIAQSETGYISSMVSNADGTFDTNPVITIKLSEPAKNIITGLSINFDLVQNEYPTQFNVQVLKGDVNIANYTISGNRTSEWMWQRDFYDYDTIIITIQKWCLGYHRARITNVYFGAIKTFDDDDLLDLSIKQKVDVLDGTLPTYELTFELNNINDMFNIDNPEGLYGYLIERQKVDVEIGYKIKGKEYTITGGIFYLSSWKTSQNNIGATFEARELLYFLTDNYYKGTYNSKGKTLYDLLTTILEETNSKVEERDRNKWVLDEEKLKSYTTTAPIPLCTYAQAIQYIAEASQCSIWYDREGYLHIAPIDFTNPQITEQPYVIDQFVAYEYPEISMNEVLKSVEVKIYSFYKDESNQKLYDGIYTNDTTSDEIILEYSSSGVAEKISDVSPSSATFTIVDPYTYACDLKVAYSTTDTDISFIVYGTSIKNSNISYTKQITTTNNGVDESVSNQLVSNKDMAKDILQWVADWRSLRRNVEVEYRADPRLDATDVILVQKKLGEEQYEAVLVEEVDYQYAGSFKGTVKGRSVNSDATVDFTSI